MLVCDPYDPAMTGMTLPKLDSVSVVTVSHHHADHDAVFSGPFVIDKPGEYEVSGITVVGVACSHDDKNGLQRGKNIAYQITIDGVSVCHLGDLGHRLTSEQLEGLGGVDVLLVPVGGFFTLDAKGAAEVVTQIGPKIVIPMHYKTPKHKEENFEKLESVEPFLKEMGVEGLVSQPKLSVSADRLPEQLQVAILES
jgi:L-ascorbate metabolism protein UlaG (beta-lactamase superfamily)